MIIEIQLMHEHSSVIQTRWIFVDIFALFFWCFSLTYNFIWALPEVGKDDNSCYERYKWGCISYCVQPLQSWEGCLKQKENAGYGYFISYQFYFYFSFNILYQHEYRVKIPAY